MLEWERLETWSSQAASLALSDRVLDQLRRYVQLLRVWNRSVSLVARDDLAVLLHKHVADSLFAAAHCPALGALADLGSGAGFPGLVIAIVRPALRVTLIEARGKKVSFLEEARRVAGIDNAEPVHGRIEEVSADPDRREAYQCVTSRALADLEVLRGLAAPLAAPGAILLAMRSAAAPVPTDAGRIDYSLPDGTPRTLVTIRL